MMTFQPIAIVGQGCVLPGCLGVDALNQTVREGATHLSGPPSERWRVEAKDIRVGDGGGYYPNHAYSAEGGYIDGFETHFRPDRFGDNAERIAKLDPLVQWSLQAAADALRSGLVESATTRARTGVILGNLSYPTVSMTKMAESVCLAEISAVGQMNHESIDSINRFMSGYPALFLRDALGLGGDAFCLDAACASGLYAIKLACDRLMRKECDAVLAGAVNAADPWFLHVGFSALGALSPQGLSRPFNREADGLVPAEGAAFLTLKRLDDALKNGDCIHGVIRGVSLSNDGRSGGFLSPSGPDQIRCLERAYHIAGVDPASVSYVECHATGTSVGDGIEIGTLQRVFGPESGIALGSLKGNLGHLITASGIAGLIKLLGMLRSGSLPTTPNAYPILPAIAESGFHVPDTPQPWDSDQPRVAGLNAFGFGGNNAHLILEEWCPRRSPVVNIPEPSRVPPVAVVGFGVSGAGIEDAEAFTGRLFGRTNEVETDGEEAAVSFDRSELKFPPKDLEQSLGQQLLMLKAASEALRMIGELDRSQCGVFVGMQTDAEVCRYGLSWRLENGLLPKPTGNHGAQIPPLEAAGVIGTMPNVVANRISNQEDLKGCGFAVSAEELSGDVALRVAMEAIGNGEIKSAVVGAVDASNELVHELCVRQIVPEYDGPASDVAVVLIIKPLSVAEAEGDCVYGVIEPDGVEEEAVDLLVGNCDEGMNLSRTFGHAHCASGLLQILGGCLALYYQQKPCLEPGDPVPILPKSNRLIAKVDNVSFGGMRQRTYLSRCLVPHSRNALLQAPCVSIATWCGESVADLVEALQRDDSEGVGGCRVAVLYENQSERQQLRERSLKLLTEPGVSEGWIDEKIHYRGRSVAGEIAFVYSGAASAYSGMGRELLLTVPGLIASLQRRSGDLDQCAGWAYDTESPLARDPFAQLCGSSFLCQVHAEFSRDVLRLQPDRIIGLSSGETNSICAHGVWARMDDLFADIRTSEMFDYDIAGRFDAVRRHWGESPGYDVQWENWRLRASVLEIEALVAKEERAYVTIINSPKDCVIGGDAAACQRIVSAVGRLCAIPLGHDIAIHCPAILPLESEWQAVHTRDCQDVSDVKFYSNYLGGVYEPTPENVAAALTGQAMQTIDFPMIVERAWEDGARVFVGHGPREALCHAIGEILGDREYLTVSLDRSGQNSFVQAVRASVELWCAGVRVDLSAFRTPVGSPLVIEADSKQRLTFPIHKPKLKRAPKERILPAPPSLIPEPLEEAVSIGHALPTHQSESVEFAGTHDRCEAASSEAVADQTVEGHARVATAHQRFMMEQTRAQSEFVAYSESIRDQVLAGSTSKTVAGSNGRLNGSGDVIHRPQSAPSPPDSAAVGTTSRYQRHDGFEPGQRLEPAGSKFNRAELEVHASGAISSLFGEQFKQQDEYSIQVRMPEPPLLLCDRVTGISGDAGGLGNGVVWTETDVTDDRWYLHNGRMPAGVFIESGQADLFLISWLGIDFHNRGERAYRLLGCELVFHAGGLPQVGDRLEYQIHVDGHAKQGDVRLFFFHYDRWIDGVARISVRNGQAGFFTKQELAESTGVLWSPVEAAYCERYTHHLPRNHTGKQSFAPAEVEAYTQGEMTTCFGEALDWTRTHTRTPSSQEGAMNFIHEITDFELHGGPAGRGYLRAVSKIQPDDWYFKGHFKNDPCMPGTLMAEACLQMMAFYLVGLGTTGKRDGWRFEPVSEEEFKFVCRGQITPEHQEAIYELYVDEIILEPYPTLYAHVLTTVEGRKAFLCERLGLRLIPDWPLTSQPTLAEPGSDNRCAVVRHGFPFDYASLIQCAIGQPSKAFGADYRGYDGIIRSPRLPGPPYHFVSRLCELNASYGDFNSRPSVRFEYDIPADAWYFDENMSLTMPNAVLMEVALQPCGWLSTFVAKDVIAGQDLLFRNLDGTAVQHREIAPPDSVLSTTATMTGFARSGANIIVKFSVECSIKGERVYEVETVFGFFTVEALADQKGLPPEDWERNALATAPNLNLSLDAFSQHGLPSAFAPFFRGRLPMIDRICTADSVGGKYGKGYLKAEKVVDAGDWFFKAHFFQDPVQPGSLGVEAMLQLIQFDLLRRGLHQAMHTPRFEPNRIGATTEWHYRGQVTPANDLITVECDIKSIEEEQGVWMVTAEARLWVDGLLIYRVPEIGGRLYEDEG